MSELDTNPRYTIKVLGNLPATNPSLLVVGYGDAPSAAAITLFRVTGYSAGGSGLSRGVIQSHFGRTF